MTALLKIENKFLNAPLKFFPNFIIFSLTSPSLQIDLFTGQGEIIYNIKTKKPYF